MTSAMAAILGPGGAVSRRLPGYESRPAQVAMAETVAAALEHGGHALVEGGTGVGKSLAYLVPAIYSGKRIIISTANKALQDQLMTKDIPFLQHALPKEVSAALVKGRSNYLCLDRLDDEERYQTMSGFSYDYRRVKSWAASTGSGDFEELEIVPSRDLLSRVASTSRTCIGTACDHYHECFIEKMRARAESSSLVVCNHALLLADLHMRDEGAQALPDRDAVIIDEAHRLEDAALAAFTVSLSRRDVADLAENAVLRRYAGEHSVSRLPVLADALFRALERSPTGPNERAGGAHIVTGQFDEGLTLAEGLSAMVEHLLGQEPFRGARPTRESRQYDNALAWASRLAEDVQVVSSLNDEDSVRYVERIGSTRSREMALKWTPIDVSGLLADILFRQTPVICTSATLTVGDFAYFRRAVGVDVFPIDDGGRAVAELIAPSPFDYGRQCLIYIASGIPEFRRTPTPEYSAAVCDEIERLVRVSAGRAFVLFTSYRGLEDAHGVLCDRLPFTVLRQGEAPRAELLRRFRADGSAVLFGTRSFWEGIDVVGDALSLVVIDRMPFTVPDDPVVATRVERMKHHGEDWFRGLMLPSAILQLKQGMGRLIRSHTDRGVVAILDSRLAHKWYGRSVIRSLPPARVSQNIEDVEEFFSSKV